jgi:hypothetical protein
MPSQGAPGMAGAIDVYLVAGGKYHDIDFARRELLGLLGEHERVRVRVGEDYSDLAAIRAARMLITYTCDVTPDAAGLDALGDFLGAGRRWFALHGTNSVLRFVEGDKVDSPPLDPRFRAMIGSQFMAHPPIGRYKVSVAAKDDPLVAGIGSFMVEDEHYLCDYEPGSQVLLTTRFAGRTDMFVRNDWPDGEHPVLYRRSHGGGEVLYLTLGHVRGRYDLRPLADFYPFVERGAWTLPVYYELLRRGIRWALETA